MTENINRLKIKAYGKSRLMRLQEQHDCETSLINFVAAAWSSIDSAPYQSCWPIDALCEHLQAVTDGHIKRLLINFPPRCGKTLTASVCFPAWTWARQQNGYLSGPQVRFLCASYNHELALTNSNLTRRLLLSQWYQKLWGKRFTFRPDQNTKTKYDTSEDGSRVSTSVSGSLLGIGGDIVIVDDPHNTEQVESAAERATVLRWWSELSTTRLNDPKKSPIIVIMQRLHEDDVSGHILSSKSASEWDHLCIPMSYDWPRHCVTSIEWQDPRGLDQQGQPLVTISEDGERSPRDPHAATVLDEQRQGTLMWPERFGPTEIIRMKAELGEYMASGRLEQAPVPDKGGIFQRDWWQPWNSVDGKFPSLEYVVASLDSAFTADQQNDPSGFTVWGIFRHRESGRNRAILLHAWRKHLPFSGPRSERMVGETEQEHKFRTRADWGLIEWIADTCTRFKVDKLLIEAKANGISAAQELRNRYGLQDWAVQLCRLRGDKVARALRVQPIFSQGLVYAPARDWADMVITEMAVFPLGRHDDLTDSTTQALSYLRTSGLLPSDEEAKSSDMQNVTPQPKLRAIYPV